MAAGVARVIQGLLLEMLGDGVDYGIRMNQRSVQLRQLIAEVTEPKARQAARCLVLRVAREAAMRGLHAVANDLNWVATEGSVTSVDWLVEKECLEVTAPAVFREQRASMVFRIAATENHPIAPGVARLIETEDMVAVGAGFEPKFRFVGVERLRDDLLNATVVRDRWETGAGFHHHLRTKGGFLLIDNGKCLDFVPFGPACLPGVATAHAIILTSDKKVILARRSDKTEYAPGAWSASFEEQITSSDIRGGFEAAAAAARRGFQEEFGMELPKTADSIAVLSTVLEIGNLNLSVVVAVFSDASANEIIRRWESEPRPVSHWEATAIEAVGLDRSKSRMLDESVFSSFHPTSLMRIRMLQRWLGEN